MSKEEDRREGKGREGKGRRGEAEAKRHEGHMRMETEIGVVQPRAKECQGLQKPA